MGRTDTKCTDTGYVDTGEEAEVKVTVVMADPAGNRTAIVRQGVPKSARGQVAREIMENADLGAEQIGFETRPLYGGSTGRLEMAGGEFCGNAARSYGYLLCRERGLDHCKIEMSGTREKLEVICDLENETSAAQMPMPERLEMAGEAADALFPLVVSRGITHMICMHRDPDEEFADRMIRKFGGAYSAFGVQFVGEGKLTPVVYVAQTGTVCWESSCGSGSLAAAWYLTQEKEDGLHVYSFEEPGGTIIVKIAKRQGKFAGTIGGNLTLEEPVELEIG